MLATICVDLRAGEVDLVKFKLHSWHTTAAPPGRREERKSRWNAIELLDKFVNFE